MSSRLPFLKLKSLLAPKISKFTKTRKFQKKLYANWRLLNDYELIISIKTNKKGYVGVSCIFKIGDVTSTLIYFPISVHAHRNGKVDWRARSVSNFEDTAYTHISFSIHLNRMNMNLLSYFRTL